MRLSTFAVIGALSLTGSHLQAQTSCHSISDDGDRLRCYDNANSGLSMGQAEQESDQGREVEATPTSSWMTKVSSSPLDGEKSAIIWVESSDFFTNKYGQRARGTMTVQCVRGTTAIYISWGREYMVDDGKWGDVAYRIDEQPAEVSYMHPSVDNEALGLYNPETVFPFLERLGTGQKIYVQAAPYRSNPIGMTFNINGYSEAVAPIRETCGW